MREEDTCMDILIVIISFIRRLAREDLEKIVMAEVGNLSDLVSATILSAFYHMQRISTHGQPTQNPSSIHLRPEAIHEKLNTASSCNHFRKSYL